MGNLARFFMVVGAAGVGAIAAAYMFPYQDEAILIGAGIGGMLGAFLAGRTFG